MAEVLLHVFTERILGKVLSLVSEEVNLISGFKAELRELGDNSKMIQALLSDFGNKQFTTSSVVQLWLKKLKVASSDAEDLLDEIAYEALRRKVENKVLDFFSPSNTVLFRVKMSQKIKRVNDVFDGIYQEATKIGPRPIELINNMAEHGEIRLTHPFVDESEVLGRDADVSTIVDDLVSMNDARDLSVTAIVGMGGLGKTTLAQLIYKNEKIAAHFDCRIWVCVSHDFNIMRLLKEMLQSLNKVNSDMSNVEALVKKLQESISGKRLFLVLDDVWNESESKWDSLKNSFLGMGGSRGSKILVTARSVEVAKNMQATFTHCLVGLSDDDSWVIFKRRALGEGGAKETPDLVAIGRRILKRCGGVPLAIKALGGLMHSKKGEHEWLSIQNSEIWECVEDENGVMATLRLSYDHLPSTSLKQCFTYCSIFLKDSYIVKDNLIELWMAQGYLQPPKGSLLLMEDIGKNYFNILSENSLLQDVKEEYDGNTTYTICKMHDLVHDLAVSISKNDCLALYDKEMNDISEVQHLSCVLWKENNLKLLKGRVNRLHTLVYTGKLAGDFFTSFTYLRALSLTNFNMKELPGSISKLKHLRYLSISGSNIQKLPDSVTRLYNLQTLKLIGCSNMKEFPNNYEKLISLRHFYIECNGRPMDILMVGIREMTSLQTLPHFVVSREKGCQIQDLKRLNSLRGKLEIYGLEGVKNKEEAEEANLIEKSNVHSLKLYWEKQRGEEYNDDEEVMEGLEPHKNLKDLTIENFRGERFGSWMMTSSKMVLNNLEEITLLNCARCEVIPAMGQLPNLKVVKIKGLDKVKSIGSEFYGGARISRAAFPALKELRLISMGSLEEWLEVVTTTTTGSSTSGPLDMVVFPCLEKLDIWRCPKLISAPSHFPSLKTLTVERINSGEAIAEMSRKLTSLTSLEFGDVNSVVLKELLGNNLSLKEMTINKCDDLISLPKELSNLMDLQELSIASCPMLIEIPDMQRLTSMHTLKIRECEKLVKLPSELVYSKSLQELTILNCPALEFGESCSHVKLGHLYQLCIGAVSLSGGGEVDYFPWPLPLPLSSLEMLTLNGWSKLKSLPTQLQYLPALKHLTLSYFDGLEVVPEWFGNLSSLQSLILQECKTLVKLPRVEAMRRLTNLQYLSIYNCPLLKKRCRRRRGPEWPKIAHIPYLYID